MLPPYDTVSEHSNSIGHRLQRHSPSVTVESFLIEGLRRIWFIRLIMTWFGTKLHAPASQNLQWSQTKSLKMSSNSPHNMASSLVLVSLLYCGCLSLSSLVASVLSNNPSSIILSSTQQWTGFNSMSSATQFALHFAGLRIVRSKHSRDLHQEGMRGWSLKFYWTLCGERPNSGAKRRALTIG